MTTGKRQIPINNNDAAGAGPAAAAGPAQAAHGGAARAATAATGTSAKTAPTKGAPAGGPAAQLDQLVAEREALVIERDNVVAERDALADMRLRLQAEFDNFRKRVSRDSIESHVRTQCEVLGDFLPVLDNLERALDAAEHHEESKVLDGVRLTRDMFVGLLGRAGVEEIEGVGTRFDPQIHDAVLVQPSEHDEGSVAAILERGYRQGDRVLRPARVVVSAGRAGSDRTGSAAPAGGTAGSGGSTTSG